MRDFLNRLTPAPRTFIEMQVHNRPTSVVEMEALVMYWADMSHGRVANSRINELSAASPYQEPMVHPGSPYPTSTFSQSSTSMPYMPMDSPGMPDMSAPHNQGAHIQVLQRTSAGRHAATRGRVPGRGRPEMQAAGTPCSHCKGTHPDIPNGKCPTVGSAARDSEFAKNADNRKKVCHWMCNRKFRCEGEGHLSCHHRQELEAVGVTVHASHIQRDMSSRRTGQGRPLGRFRNSRSTPQSRGTRRAIRALINNNLVYVQAVDQGDGFDEI